MNTMLKIAAGFVLGAAAGSLVTYFVLRDSFQANADEQIENMRAYYIKYPPTEKERKAPEEKIDTSKFEKVQPFTSDEKKDYQKLSQKYTARYVNPDMEDLMARVNEEINDEGETISIELDKTRIREKPYLIPEESYMRHHGLFGNDVLEYWVQDNVLTVADSNEVLDIPSTIGLDAINALLDPGRVSDVVFVRNEKIEMEYEVERNEGSYAEWIGEDIPEEPVQPQQRRFRNKYEDDDD